MRYHRDVLWSETGSQACFHTRIHGTKIASAPCDASRPTPDGTGERDTGYDLRRWLQSKERWECLREGLRKYERNIVLNSSTAVERRMLAYDGLDVTVRLLCLQMPLRPLLSCLLRAPSFLSNIVSSSENRTSILQQSGTL